MSSVLISSSNLTNIANAIRQQNGSIQTYTPAQMSAAIQELGYKKMYETTLTVATTDTAATAFTTLKTTLSDLYTKDKLVYIKIRDTEGPRQGYFFGDDTWFANYRAASNLTSTMSIGSHLCYRNESDGTWGVYSGGYGVYPYSINSVGSIVIRTRYHDTYSLTINSTYKLEAFLVSWPFGIIPWEENKTQGE